LPELLFRAIRTIALEFHDDVSPLAHDALAKLLEEKGFPPSIAWMDGSANACCLHGVERIVPPVSIRASVILATYNQPRQLDLALFGYSTQTARDFEIVIADDGSNGETAEVIAAHARRARIPIRHVWQPHRGFGSPPR